MQEESGENERRHKGRCQDLTERKGQPWVEKSLGNRYRMRLVWKVKANLEEGRRHQKIQIIMEVCEPSSSQKLESSLMCGARMTEKTSLQREMEESRSRGSANTKTILCFKDHSLSF